MGEKETRVENDGGGVLAAAEQIEGLHHVINRLSKLIKTTKPLPRSNSSGTAQTTAERSGQARAVLAATIHHPIRTEILCSLSLLIPPLRRGPF